MLDNQNWSDEFLKDDTFEDLNIPERQRQALLNLDLYNQRIIAKILREKQADEENRKYAQNRLSIVKNDADKTSQLSSLSKAKKTGQYRESSKFAQILQSVFGEEGGYEDNPKKIDQPTNIGITQPTLNNFNAAHPNLKINKPLKEISREDAELIYKLDFYDHYSLEKIENKENTKVLLHMFVMLKPNTALNLIHQSLNELGYPCQKLLTREMIPMLNRIEKDNKSDDFKEILKSNYTKYLQNSSEAKKYRGWFPRIERL